jgi:hypothetical protein
VQPTLGATVRFEENVMKAKGWLALSALDPAERSRALDLIGLDRQLLGVAKADFLENQQFATHMDRSERKTVC